MTEKKTKYKYPEYWREWQKRNPDKVLAAKRKYYLNHKEELREKQRKWSREHPERVREYKRKSKIRHPSYQITYGIKRRHGITPAQYETIILKARNKCEICGITFASEKQSTMAHIDHDHKTNIIRGALCGNCNRGLGMFYDNQILLKNAISYLERCNNDSRPNS